MDISYIISSGSFADKALRIPKYALLFLVFFFTVKSSELFCMRFDPYYAIATGFKGEIIVWMALAAIALLIFGSIYYKMFWCKYICPLGASSNLFRFTLLFVGMVVLIYALNLIGVRNGWVWGLGIACLFSYILEITCLKHKTLSLLRIVRNDNVCTSCCACEKKCPYSIPVSQNKKIMDVDCTLCCDCVTNCQVGALSVNSHKSFRLLPGLITVVLFVLSLILGRNWELPTIDLKWGDWEQVQSLKTIEQKGLASVKCYASSIAFAVKMEQVPGIYGVKAYVVRHTVVLTYDPTVIDTLGIQKAFFTPIKMKFSTPSDNSDSLRIIRLGVDGLLDRTDVVYLGNILRAFDGIYGFETNFDCPIEVKLYTNPAIMLDHEALKDSIQAKGVAMMTHGGPIKIIPINYKLVNFNPDAGRMDPKDFIFMIFDEIRDFGTVLKDNMEKYGDDDEYPKAVFQISFPDIEKPPIKNSFPYFRSFLSNCDGITCIQIELVEMEPVLLITYVKSLWDDNRIQKEIFNAPVWMVKYMDGSVREEEPKFTFRNEGKTILID
ncbi:MAG: 4Fe-4S ferredoxin [Prevotellaceae bacterium]|jgi:ferredoxin|nr:4Fe-4S ferredoxin [Prevotellaceae bacterium]